LLEDQENALMKLKATMLHNRKKMFVKTYRLTKLIKFGDWMLVFNSNLEHQHSTPQKNAQRWFGPYVVIEIHYNATYYLHELDGTRL
jgi:hypothetical protein